MNYCEIIADNLRKLGWRQGCISSTDRDGPTIWVVAAEQEDAGRFIVHADDSLESRMKYWEIIADNLSKAGWSFFA